MFDYECRRLTKEEILEVIGDAEYCNLGVAECDVPYIVPMYYEWDYDNCRLTFLLCSRDCGEKMACMKRNKNVCIEIEKTCKGAIKTVVARGVVGRFIHDDGKCDCDIVKIEILVNTVSGRAFSKHDKNGGYEEHEQ